MNGQQRFEMVEFFRDCELKVSASKSSSYYEIKYKEFVFNFCISDHLAKHRKNLITIISKDRRKNKAKQIAYEMWIKAKTPKN
jgi:hypothetical protein